MRKLKYYFTCIALLTSVVTFNAFAFAVTDNTSNKLRFYIVRHGQTYSNIKHMTIGGGGNAQLTAKGRYDARSLGLSLANVNFLAAYSSTLDRAYETANNILTGRDLSVTKIAGLKDISWGTVEGGLIADLEKKYGHMPNDYAYYFDTKSPVKAEDMGLYAKRIDDTLHEIAQQHKNENGNILVVSHSSLLFYFQTYRPELPMEGLSNTSVSILEYENGKFTLVDFNNTEYLKEGHKKEQALAPLEISVIINPMTIFQEIGTMEGTTDSDLTMKGINASKALQKKIANENYVAAYSSTLGRAQQTADIVLENHSAINTINDSNLNEIFLGYWEAEQIENIKNSITVPAKNLFSTHHVVNFISPNGGETGEIAAYRLGSTLANIGKEHEFSKDKVLVFTHPLVFKAFLNKTIPDYALPDSDQLQLITLQYKNEKFTVKDVQSFAGD